MAYPTLHPKFMPRFLLPSNQWEEAELTGDEAKHLAQVLRIKSGEEITVFNGKGRRASAIVKDVSRNRVRLVLGEFVNTRPQLPTITLSQAIPKGKNMELIVQKAVELGVAIIQPLITQHTIVQPGKSKVEKWRRIALEACKQCGQDILPAIAEPMHFRDWIASSDLGEISIIASLADGARPMREVIRNHSSVVKCDLLVGPEGDFAPSETAAAIEAGYQPVTLGDIVLRVETASLYCLSALRYEFS